MGTLAFILSIVASVIGSLVLGLGKWLLRRRTGSPTIAVCRVSRDGDDVVVELEVPGP